MENSMTQEHIYILFASWGAADAIKDFFKATKDQCRGS